MKSKDIAISGTYLAKVGANVVVVRIDRESAYGGWDATNLVTNRRIRIKSAQRLRCPANRTGSAQARTEIFQAAPTSDGAS